MVTWKIYVDWDGDGITEADNISSDVRYASWSLGFADDLERVSGESQLELELLNADRKYSPDYSSGTYYGKFAPHKRVRVDSISSEGTITHWHGWLKTVRPDSNIDTPYARLMASDSKPYLEKSKVTYKLYQDVTADEVIRDIITQAREWSPSMEPSFVLGQSILGTDTLADEDDSFNFDTGVSTFTYAGDTWTDDTSPYRAISDLVRAENGYFFYSREGSATFYARDAFANLGRTNIGTLTYEDYLDISYAYGDDIINEVLMEIAPRTLNSTASILYTMPESFTLKPEAEREFRCRFESQDSEIDIATVPEQCYAIVEWQDSNGGKSGAVQYTVEYFARYALVTITNGTAGEVTVTQIDVYGPNISRKNKQEIVARDDDSIGKYGLRQLVINSDLLEDEAAASVIVNSELSKRKEPYGIIRTVFLRTKPDESNLEQMLTWGIGTRFEIDDYPTAHNQSYFIIGESHTLSNGFKTHDASFTLKSAANEDYFLLGTSLLDGDDILFA